MSGRWNPRRNRFLHGWQGPNRNSPHVEKTVVYTIDKARFMRLQFEDPSFGLAIMRSVTRRLSENAQHPATAQVRPQGTAW